MTADDRLLALADTAAALAGELGLDAVLQRIVEVAAELTGARYVALGVLGPDQTIERFVTHGVGAEVERAIGHYPTGQGVLGVLIRDPQILRLDDVAEHPASVGFPPGHPPMKSFLGGPVRSGGRVFGNLYLTEKPGGFDEEDERALVVLSAQAGAAIENAQLSDRLQRLAVQQERDRIGRDLHDGVIQTLFSIGMGLEAARGLVDRDPVRAAGRIEEAVDSIDGAIRELRNYIFHLQPDRAAELGLSRGLTELAREFEVNALNRPELDLAGDLDAQVPTHMVPDLLQIVRESLSNAAKHARANQVQVEAHVRDTTLTVRVVDDGVGFTPGSPDAGRGLENMQQRAQALAGDLTVRSDPGQGTGICLQVHLEEQRR